MANRFSRASRSVALAAAVGLLAACGAETEYNYPERRGPNRVKSNEQYDSIFGPGGFSLFGGGKKEENGGGGGIGVNGYLWRASLDTISFMPLASADPFGGVIITDWFTPPETPNERFKLNVYILGRELRGDGVKAAVFRQRRDAAGGWVDSTVEPKTSIDLENSILTRARQLRLDQTARP